MIITDFNFLIYEIIVRKHMIMDNKLWSIQTLFIWKSGFNPRSSHTKDSKIVLDPFLLNTQHYKLRIKGKVDQSGK